jgi:hypothetical protein
VASASHAQEPANASPTLWTGRYTSAPGSIYVFDGGEWAGVTWRGDDAGLGLGEGEVSLHVDDKTSAVIGSADGAIGDVEVQGTLDGDKLTASVLRKDPKDRGLSGVLAATISGDQMRGEMKLSVADARVLREATFTLSRHP